MKLSEEQISIIKKFVDERKYDVIRKFTCS